MLKSKRKIAGYIVRFAIVAVLLVPYFSDARGLVPCGGDGEKPCNITDIFILIAHTTNWLILMAGIMAVYNIISAGFWLVLSMGDQEAITTKRKAILDAIIGFIMVMMAFMFMNTVVNLLLKSKCKINLSDPLTYLKITDYNDPKQCVKPQY